MRQLSLSKLSLLSRFRLILVFRKLLILNLLICLIVNLYSNMVHPLLVQISNALLAAPFPSGIRVSFLLTQTHVCSLDLLVLRLQQTVAVLLRCALRKVSTILDLGIVVRKLHHPLLYTNLTAILIQLDELGVTRGPHDLVGVRVPRHRLRMR